DERDIEHDADQKRARHPVRRRVRMPVAVVMPGVVMAMVVAMPLVAVVIPGVAMAIPGVVVAMPVAVMAVAIAVVVIACLVVLVPVPHTYIVPDRGQPRQRGFCCEVPPAAGPRGHAGDAARQPGAQRVGSNRVTLRRNEASRYSRLITSAI